MSAAALFVLASGPCRLWGAAAILRIWLTFLPR